MPAIKNLVWSKLKSTLRKQRINRKEDSGSMVNKPNVNEEYVGALRTKSYMEIYTKVQGQLMRGGAKLSLAHTSSHLCCEEVSESYQLHPLLISYFEINLEACRICELLLQSIHQTKANYSKIRKAIRLEKRKQDSNHSYGVYRALSSFSSFRNPFSNVNQLQFLETREGQDSLLHKLNSKFNKVSRRVKLLRSCKKVLGIGVAVGYAGIMAAVLVLLLHSMVCIVAAPGLMASSFGLLKKRFKVDKDAIRSSSSEVLIAQLDVAAKGVYILINDFDTMSGLVRTLYYEVEHYKSVADTCARTRNSQFLKDVVRDFNANQNCFMEQLKELEEHVYLCFLTISRSRRMVLQEIK